MPATMCLFAVWVDLSLWAMGLGWLDVPVTFSPPRAPLHIGTLLVRDSLGRLSSLVGGTNDAGYNRLRTSLPVGKGVPWAPMRYGNMLRERCQRK